MYNKVHMNFTLTQVWSSHFFFNFIGLSFSSHLCIIYVTFLITPYFYNIHYFV